jgi:hypothetical protein
MPPLAHLQAQGPPASGTDLQPGPLPPKPAAHQLTAVGGQPIPHQRRLLFTKETAQPFQGTDQRGGVVALPLEPMADHRRVAPRRRALRRILGPVLGHPAGDRPLVTFDGAAGGTQQAIAQPVAQQLPDVTGMMADPGEPLDHGGHALKGPVVGVEAVRAGTLAQRLVIRCSCSSDRRGAGPVGPVLRSAWGPPACHWAMLPATPPIPSSELASFF